MRRHDSTVGSGLLGVWGLHYDVSTLSEDDHLTAIGQTVKHKQQQLDVLHIHICRKKEKV